MFFHDVLESSEIALLSGEVPPLDLGMMVSLRDVANADCIAVIGVTRFKTKRCLVIWSGGRSTTGRG